MFRGWFCGEGEGCRLLWYIMLCSSLRTRLQSWLRDYDKLQSVAIILLYVQVSFYCSLMRYMIFMPVFLFYIAYVDLHCNYSDFEITWNLQIGCTLLGSLGPLYNGVLLINLAIALFALVAIESGSQSLGRTYAFLLVSAILLDIIWFVLFSNEIWWECVISLFDLLIVVKLID